MGKWISTFSTGNGFVFVFNLYRHKQTPCAKFHRVVSVLRAQNRYVVPTKLHKHGNGMCIRVNRAVRELIPWQVGDTIAVRVAGEKLILERIDLETFGRIRTGTPEGREPSNE